MNPEFFYAVGFKISCLILIQTLRARVCKVNLVGGITVDLKYRPAPAVINAASPSDILSIEKLHNVLDIELFRTI